MVKDQNSFSKTSVQKYLLKMAQYSKQTFNYHISNTTDLNPVRLKFREKLGKTMHDIIIKTNLKQLYHGSDSISPTMQALHDRGLI